MGSGAMGEAEMGNGSDGMRSDGRGERASSPRHMVLRQMEHGSSLTGASRRRGRRLCSMASGSAAGSGGTGGVGSCEGPQRKRMKMGAGRALQPRALLRCPSSAQLGIKGHCGGQGGSPGARGPYRSGQDILLAPAERLQQVNSGCAGPLRLSGCLSWTPQQSRRRRVVAGNAAGPANPGGCP